MSVCVFYIHIYTLATEIERERDMKKSILDAFSIIKMIRRLETY